MLFVMVGFIFLSFCNFIFDVKFIQMGFSDILKIQKMILIKFKGVGLVVVDNIKVYFSVFGNFLGLEDLVQVRNLKFNKEVIERINFYFNFKYSFLYIIKSQFEGLISVGDVSENFFLFVVYEIVDEEVFIDQGIGLGDILYGNF